MISLEDVPGLGYTGAADVRRAIGLEAAGGAVVALTVAKPLERIAAITAEMGRAAFGPVGGHLFWYAGWLVAVWVALVVLGRWARSLDEGEDDA